MRKSILALLFLGACWQAHAITESCAPTATATQAGYSGGHVTTVTGSSCTFASQAVTAGQTISISFYVTGTSTYNINNDESYYCNFQYSINGGTSWSSAYEWAPYGAGYTLSSTLASSGNFSGLTNLNQIEMNVVAEAGVMSTGSSVTTTCAVTASSVTVTVSGGAVKSGYAFIL